MRDENRKTFRMGALVGAVLLAGAAATFFRHQEEPEAPSENPAKGLVSTSEQQEWPDATAPQQTEAAGEFFSHSPGRVDGTQASRESLLPEYVDETPPGRDNDVPDPTLTAPEEKDLAGFETGTASAVENGATAPTPGNEALPKEKRRIQVVVRPGSKRSWVEGEEQLFLGPREEPLQSPARPLGLEPVGPVEADVYDPDYLGFVNEALPPVGSFLEDHFSDRPEIENNSLELEMTDLVMPADGDVRVYFIKEGTIFHNTLGIVRNGEDKLIFPNASSFVSYFKDIETRTAVTREEAPLLPGDYVDLGRLRQGELIDLFLIKDGARDENGERYGLNKTGNPDALNHIRIHGAYNDLLIIGFEDIPGGGDRDYNDLVIAIEVTAPGN